jgi:hypothetical protein
VREAGNRLARQRSARSRDQCRDASQRVVTDPGAHAAKPKASHADNSAVIFDPMLCYSIYVGD